MPLEFERIINLYLSNLSNNNDMDKIYENTKRQILDLINIKDLTLNKLFSCIPFDKVQNIITTNYDSLLEQAADNTDKVDIHVKYLFSKTNTNGKLNFFHPHGYYTNPKSICLGYNHYMRLISKSYGILGANDRIISHLQGTPNEEIQNTWLEKFFTSDIAIIGFGLDTCELDLYWILTYRASLYYTNKNGIRSNIKNKIVYFDVIDDIQITNFASLNQQKKHNLLKSLHVEIKTFSLKEFNGNYSMIYTKIFKLIEEDSYNWNK